MSKQAAQDSDAALSLILRRAENSLRQRLQPALDVEGLLFEHWQIMAVLLAKPGLRMSAIADAAVLPPATLTRHMDKLVEHALVIRRIDPDDKRSTVVALSARGATFAGQLRAVEQELVSSLGPKHYTSLVGELTRLS
ncbi:MAG TPA: MarR family transcriptional regulator [Jatrophihabitans sp.]|jgi:DNA-binding MarR family transcriptional regulator